MAFGPGNVVPSADDPRSKPNSLAGLHQPPPFTRLLLSAVAAITKLPFRYTFGRPPDSVRCRVFDSPSVKSLKRKLMVLEIAPLSTLPDAGSIRPRVTSSGSTP